MTFDEWVDLARESARRSGVPDLSSAIETLFSATRALRAADWNRRADAAGEPPPAGRTPAEESVAPAPAGPVVSSPGARRAPREDGRPSIAALASALRERRESSRALTEACLGEIDRRNREVNAFITVTADLAREQAEAADRELAHGHSRGLLHGIPVSLKDLIDLAGAPTTAASRVRAGLVAERDAIVTAQLKRAGAVIVGKTNLHEFALGTTSEDSAFGPVRHPGFPDRSPGGSSGGSAAAVAAGMCVASIGTDTGGSIRIPSAACGLVGFKPPFGVVSCDGVVPLAPSLDHVGPIARSVGDARALYHVIRGGAADLAPVESPAPDTIRLGLLRAWFMDHLDTGVRHVFDEALARLRAAGARIVEVQIPHAPLIGSVYLHTVFAEAAAYHAATLASRPGDYTPPVRLRLELARYVLGEDYARARAGREVLTAEVEAALAQIDALALPTLPVPATLIGASAVDLGGVRDSVRSATLKLTQLFDLTGHPAISLPAGSTADGLPVGLQLVGRHASPSSMTTWWSTQTEVERLLAVAETVEGLLAASSSAPRLTGA
jgi:aspartyl-tRNA(Asn)/glutamyl-tRNA(Gln) amidotransferase subunit A